LSDLFLQAPHCRVANPFNVLTIAQLPQPFVLLLKPDP
jgi:hypothetical protein